MLLATFIAQRVDLTEGKFEIQGVTNNYGRDCVMTTDIGAEQRPRLRASRRAILRSVVGLGFAAARIRASSLGSEVHATDFGVVGDGRTDATEALNAAARALSANGGVLRLPRGRYRLTNSLVLKSGTVLTGSGATIVGVDTWQPGAPSRALVTNAGRGAATITDRDITVRDIAFEYVGYQFGDAHAVEFRKARHILIDGCTFSGGGNATAFLACRETEVARCVSQGTLNCAYDHWEGSSDCRVHDCVATCAQNYGILFTGVGTDPHDDEIARHCTAINNRIYSPTEAGIWVCSLSAHSAVIDITLRGNYVYGGRFNASGIGASGDIRDITIADNTIANIRSGCAIFTRPDKWNRPRGIRIRGNRLVDCDPDAASVALIQALGDNVEVAGDRAQGGHFPAMVWADGTGVVLHDNSDGALSGTAKYNLTGATKPQVADP